MGILLGARRIPIQICVPNVNLRWNQLTTIIYAFTVFNCCFTAAQNFNSGVDYDNSFLSTTCWAKLVRSIRDATTPFRECFYSQNFSLPDTTSDLEFLDPRKNLPDILFNPAIYSHSIGLVDEVHYVSQVGSKAKRLDVNYARTVLAGSSDGDTRSRYRKFCSTKTYLMPILDCLYKETLTSDSNIVCSSEDADKVSQGFISSKYDWSDYSQFCEEVFRCSNEPIRDCLSDLGLGGRLDNSLTPLESICRPLANVDLFSECVRQKIADCTTSQRSNYERSLTLMKESIQLYVGNTSELVGLCRKLDGICSAPSYWVEMGDITDECMKPLYTMMLNLGINGIERLARAGPDLFSQPDGTEAMCGALFSSLSCLSSNSNWLPCKLQFLDVMTAVMRKLIANCGAYGRSALTTPPLTRSYTNNPPTSAAKAPVTSSTQTPESTSVELEETTAVPDEQGENAEKLQGASTTPTPYAALGIVAIITLFLV